MSVIKSSLIMIVTTAIMAEAKPVMTYNSALDRQAYTELKETLKSKKNSDLEYKIVTINDTDLDTFKNALSQFDKDFNIHDHHINNTIIIHYPSKKKEALNSYLSALNEHEKSIKFSIKIVEFNTSSTEDISLLKNPLEEAIDVHYDKRKFTFLSTSFDDQLSYLNTKGQAELIAEPFLELKNGKKGQLHVGDKIPYIKTTITNSSHTTSLEHLDTGININIEPRILEDDIIHCDAKIELSVVKLWKEINGNEYPVLSSREYNSSFQIKNNESKLIVSFTDESKKENKRNTPLLSKTPILKWLFKQEQKSKQKTNLLIYAQAKQSEKIHKQSDVNKKETETFEP